VTSVDKSETRLKKLRQNLQRMGREATIISEDVLTFKPDELYDAILLDAPCSATGTLRRHPDLMMLKDNDSIKSLLELQKNILHHAFQFLKPNGILIYCVCSLEHEEGRDQIKAFLKEHPNASRANISNDELGDLNDLNIIEGDVLIFPTSLAEEGGADGFFISRLTKHK
jgi:16S rRNA (cytosine967-C5)-methyltransferase